MLSAHLTLLFGWLKKLLVSPHNNGMNTKTQPLKPLKVQLYTSKKDGRLDTPV